MWQYMSKYKTEGLKTTAINKYIYIYSNHFNSVVVHGFKIIFGSFLFSSS